MNAYAGRIRSYIEDYMLVLGSARRGLPRVLVLMLVVAGLDLIGISLIAPLAQLIASGSAPGFLPSLGQRPRLTFLMLGGTLVAIFAIKAWLAYHLNRHIQLFCENRRAELMDRLIGAYQVMDWQVFVGRSAAGVVAQTHGHTAAYSSSTLAASIWVVTNSIIFLLLVALLAAYDLEAVLLAIACLGVYAAVVHRPLQRAQIAAQRDALAHYRRTLVTVSQALGAMREVRVLGHESYFRAEVRESARLLAETGAQQSALAQVPRLAIEAVMILVIVLVAGIRFAAEGTAESAVTTLAVFAAAAMRLVPAATGILSSLSSMRSTRFVLRDLAMELKNLDANNAGLPARPRTQARDDDGAPGTFGELRLERVTFTYRGATRPALEDYGLIVRAGEAVGLMGKSGAGKSTVADIILGLLVPQSGQVLVNGRNIHESLRDWLRHAAYIPQAPYLLDDTVRRNIVFGTPEDRIDEARVNDVVDRVQLREVIDRLALRLDSCVGERGATLSGGQRQRLALARALYQGRQFLILDEATSALDEETERDVLASVRLLHGQTTMLIIAHSERTLAVCDRIERL